MQAAVLLVFAALCSSQVRGIPRDEFFRTGSQALSKGNAVSSDAVDLGENFVFFGQNQATIYVSTDGLLSFGAAVTRGTPQRFPQPRALISPFWANADTSSFGDVYYMQTRDGAMLQRASSEIQSAFSDFPDFEPTVLFVATWNEVGMANSRFRLTNTFQAVLATDGTNSFVIFLYADDMMQWTNEDVPDESVPGAQVGFNPGGGRNGFSLPTSLTQYTLNITTSSNIGKQGVWIFRVDSPQIELPGVIIGLEEVSYSVREGVGSVSICASLIGEEMDATVTVETQDVLSLADRDYTDTTLQLDFSDDVTRRCFSIDIMDDDILETEETFAVVLTTETTDIALLPQMALVVIEDNDRVTVGHLQSQWLVTESEERAFVCVQAQGQTERPIDVTVFTQGGNATVGEDYTPVTRDITIPAGSSPATCGRFIPIIDNQILEQSEFINVVVETNDEDVTIDNPTAIVIIQDNDGAGVFAGFQETEFIVGENSSSVEVCVHLTGEIGHTIGINIETVSFLRTATVGSDYLDIHEVLFFSPENSTLTQCVTITILEDQILEEDESFFVMLRSSEVALTPRQARIIIQDNDDVFVRLEQYEYFVNEFTGQLRVCAILTGTLGSFAPISIIPRPGTARPNVDYNSRVHNLNFQPPVEAGQPVRPVCANIFINNDFLYENHTEHFFVELQSSVGSVHVENRRATVYIVDNDFVFVTFTSSALALEVAEGTRSGFICIFYPSGILEVNVGVSLDTVDGTAIAGSDYRALSEEVSFRPLINGNAVNTICRRLHSIDDSVFEGNESFSLVLSTRAERVQIGRRRTEANTAILPVTIVDNDVVTVQHKELAYDVREDAGSARVCAVVTGLSESDVGVSFTTRDRGNGAVAGVDYDSVAVETFVRAGLDEVCVSIPIRDNQVQSSVRRKSFDVVLEGTHPLIRVGGEITATVTITEDDEVTVGLAQPEVSAEEGAESVTVCVTKTGEANFGITGRLVSVESALDLAEASLDYALTDANTSFTFVASRASGSYCMEIPILDDSLVEGTETFQVQVSVDRDQPVVIDRASTTITIEDNDVAVVGFQEAEYSIGEDDGSLRVCVDLEGSIERDIAVDLTTPPMSAEPGMDYVDLSMQLVFHPSESSVCADVSILSDEVVEDMESFGLLLTTTHSQVTFSTGQAVAMVIDDDSIGVRLEQSVYSIAEDVNFIQLCLNIEGDFGVDVPITVSTEAVTAEGDEDYLDISRTLLLSPTVQQSGCVDVEIRDDDILEDTETFDVLLSSPNPAVRYTTNQSARVYITDNDRVALGLRQSEYTVGEGTGVVEVCADLLGKLGRVVLIVLESLDTGGVAVARSNTDYEALSAVFEFQPSRSATRHSHCFNVSIRDDDILEDAESFTVSLTTSIDGVDVGIATAQVDIVDNDEVSVSLETPAMEVSEGLGSASVCARLTGISERVVLLALTDLPGTAQEERDYSRPAALGFRFEPSENVSCVNIGLVNDAILEHDEGFSLLMTSSDPAVTLGQTTTTLVTIRDDDTVQAVFELEEFSADENDLTVPVCVALQGSFDRSVTVTLSTVDGDTARAVQDYSPLTVDLTFAPTDESPRHCVTVSLTNDISEEETEKFWVELSTTDDSVVIPTPMVTVVITDTDIVCHDDSTFNPRGDYVWEQIPPFMETLIPCSLGPLQEGGVARRTCGMGGMWDEPRLRECRGNLADIFALLAQLKFSKDNLAELALAIMQATQDNQTFPEYLSIAARFLQEYSQLVQDAEILVDTVSFTDVLKIVDIIQEWPVDVLQLNSSQMVFSTEGISVGLVDDVGPFTHIGNTQNLAFNSHTADTGTIRASGVAISFSPGVFNLTTTNPVVTLTDDPSAVSINLKEDVTAVLHLPPSVFSKVGGSRAGLFFSVYDTAVSFPLDKTEDVDPLDDAIGTSVVAATVLGEEVARLNERITFALRLQRPNFTKPRCVSWVFGEDVWTEDGCKLESHVDGVVTCSCDHLTNFAVLVDISGRTGETRLSEDAEVAIEIISLVGVVLSLVGLIMTVITLVAFKKLRQKDSTKFRVQLCIAMALMMVVFIVGIDRTENKYVCISVSVVLHYFTLVSVLWMGAEAVLMFRKLVFVFSQVTLKFIVIVSLICWLLPLPAVIVPVVLDEDYVISEDYCFISHNIVFFVAFLGPIFSVLLFNFVMFAVVVIIICNSSRRKNKEKERAGKRKSTVRTLASLTGVMLLFGLTWVFAAFTVRSASVVFQFLFAIFNSLQGFFIFLFFVVLAKEARELWLVACGCKKQKFVSQPTAITPSGSSALSRAASLKKKFPEFDDSDMEAQVRDKPFNYWDVQYIVPPRLRWNISFSHSDTTPSHSRQVSNASPDLQTPMEQIPRQLGRVDESAEAATQRWKQYPHIEIKPVLKIRTSTPIGDREDSFMQQDTGIGFTPLTLSTATAGATTDIGTSGTARKTELAEEGSSAESSPETRRKEKLFHGLLLDKLEADNADSGLESQSSSNEHLQGATQSVTPPSEEPARRASAGATYDFTNETDI